jgi:hypothetical protein
VCASSCAAIAGPSAAQEDGYEEPPIDNVHETLHNGSAYSSPSQNSNELHDTSDRASSAVSRANSTECDIGSQGRCNDQPSDDASETMFNEFMRGTSSQNNNETYDDSYGRPCNYRSSPLLNELDVGNEGLGEDRPSDDASETLCNESR